MVVNMSNPSAFPCHPDTPPEYDGMTLRDYFAAKAMEKLMGKMYDSILEILKQSYEDDDAKEMSKLMIADTAYEWADAMLKAREQ
jgi:hypothetical protein